jgi:hypothetical protein
VIGRTHGRFWKHFDRLPDAIQKLAREKYALWQEDPFHPSLKFEERRNASVSSESAITIAPSAFVTEKSLRGSGSAPTPNTIVSVSDL